MARLESRNWFFQLLLLCGIWSFTPVAAAQTITSVSVLTDQQQSKSYVHVLNISGTDFLKLGAANTTIPAFVAPSAGTVNAQILSDTVIEARFTADTDYQLKSIVIAPAGKSSLSFVVPEITCKPDDILVQYEIAPVNQAKNTFGNGLAKNYHIIQLSIVSKCGRKIVVPLGGVRIEPIWHERQEKDKHDYVFGAPYIAPYGLDHVISVYNTDRTLTGSRALILNITQGMTTVGSAIQVFFGPGFTQGVAIFGGGFRNAMLEVMKDMSAQQLKSLSSETFQTTETVGSNGSSPVQKFIFVPKTLVKLPSGQFQRIDNINSITITWFTSSESTQTQNATKVENMQ